MAALIVILPGLAIAGWLAFLFIRHRDYEHGVIAFLSITILPFVIWYLVKWIVEDSPIGEFFYNVMGSGLTDLLPGLAMVGVFVALCIRWARRGQSLGEPAKSSGPTAPDTSAKERLEQLEKLRGDGLINDEEYTTKRAQIISTL